MTMQEVDRLVGLYLGSQQLQLEKQAIIGRLEDAKKALEEKAKDVDATHTEIVAGVFAQLEHERDCNAADRSNVEYCLKGAQVAESKMLKYKKQVKNKESAIKGMQIVLEKNERTMEEDKVAIGYLRVANQSLTERVEQLKTEWEVEDAITAAVNREAREGEMSLEAVLERALKECSESRRHIERLLKSDLGLVRCRLMCYQRAMQSFNLPLCGRCRRCVPDALRKIRWANALSIGSLELQLRRPKGEQYRIRHGAEYQTGIELDMGRTEVEKVMRSVGCQ